MPTEWRLGAFPNGTRTIEDGSFIIDAPDGAGASSVFDFDHDDLSLETQVRFLEDHPRVDAASISIRDLATGGLEGYFGAINSGGELMLARLTPGEGVDPDVRVSATQ